MTPTSLVLLKLAFDPAEMQFSTKRKLKQKLHPVKNSGRDCDNVEVTSLAFERLDYYSEP